MKQFNKTAAAIAVATCLVISIPVHADNATGSINVKANSGTSVTIINQDTGLSRTIIVGDTGRLNFSSLPTGNYVVSNGDIEELLVVTIGSGKTVDFNVERISVVGNVVSPIDLNSTESTSVFTADQLDLLPVARDITSVALLAPGTIAGDTGFGNLASFGGSSVAENGYFINGFDVTNIRNFTSFAELPFDAIAQQQVKTGGYGAEYGRSLGGVVNLVTKRGSNDWKFGGSVRYIPDDWRESGTDAISKNPDLTAADKFIAFRSKNEFDTLEYNAFVSGALIENRLFMFALAQGQRSETNDYNTQSSVKYEYTSPSYLVKIDWNITDNHILEFTHIENEQDEDTTAYTNNEDEQGNTLYYMSEHGILGDEFTTTTGGDVSIASYTGFLSDNLSLTALYGKMNSLLSARDPLVGPGAECPLVFDRRETPTSSQRIGCWGIAASQFYTPDINAEPDKDTRESLRLGFEWNVGNHTIRGGYDQELFTSTKQGDGFTGGEYWRWHIGDGGAVNGEIVADGQVYVRHLLDTSESASFEVENTAFYIEDSWQVNDQWLVYLGLRSEGFENRNGADEVFVKADNLIAPRLGFSWDIDGNGDKKLYGTLGRYYIPIASNTNIRAAGVEFFLEEYFLANSADEDPVTAAPNVLGARIGGVNINGSTNAPDSRTVAVTDLNPMHQDELILGYQQQVDDWVLGAKVVYRQIQDGMDDYCSYQPFIDWAQDNGYDNFDYHSMASCFIMNPGRDVSLALDLENDGNYVTTLVPNSYLGLDTYKRSYKGIELSFERPFADDWYIQGSYTLAKSEGNSEGYVNSTNEQEDAGLTQDIDNKIFQDGAFGPLPNDRRHTLKVFGAYKVNDQWSVSASAVVQSGRPVNCQGFIPFDNPALVESLGVDAGNLAAYGASTYYCDGVLGNRGDRGRTPWTKNIDVGISYVPQWLEGLSFKIDIRNIFNFQQVTEYVETAESGSATANVPEPDFLEPINYQSPRRVSLTARYSF